MDAPLDERILPLGRAVWGQDDKLFSPILDDHGLSSPEKRAAAGDFIVYYEVNRAKVGASRPERAV